MSVNSNPKNPLLCNPQAGVCELPGAQDAVGNRPAAVPQEKPIRLLYFTDPICSTCWGIEPQLRKLKLAYGQLLEIDYRMGGLLPSWGVYNSGGISKPADVAPHWDEVSRHYQMPIDGQLWLEDPLHSSYPPSIAFKAAQLQDAQKALVFLRRLREMVFMERKNITRWQYMQEAALYACLHPLQLKNDYNGRARELFEEDLRLARQMGVRGFPTLFFQHKSGKSSSIYGFKPYAHFEEAIRQLGEGIAPGPYEQDALQLFQHYPTLTTREFSELKDLGMAAAEETLAAYWQEGKLERLSIDRGNLWLKK